MLPSTRLVRMSRTATAIQAKVWPIIDGQVKTDPCLRRRSHPSPSSTTIPLPSSTQVYGVVCRQVFSLLAEHNTQPQFNTTQPTHRSTTQHHATPRNTTQHHAAPRSTTQHHAAPLHPHKYTLFWRGAALLHITQINWHRFVL